MNCQEIQEKLLAHRVGELDDAAAAALHQHLETCAACRAAAEETERVLDLMRSALAAGPAAPAQLDKAHRNRVLRAQFSWSGYGPSLLKIAAVLVVGVGLVALLVPAVNDARMSAKMTGTLNNGKQIYTSAFARTLDGVAAATPSTPASVAESVSRSERAAERKAAAGVMLTEETTAGQADQSRSMDALEKADSSGRSSGHQFFGYAVGNAPADMIPAASAAASDLESGVKRSGGDEGRVETLARSVSGPGVVGGGGGGMGGGTEGAQLGINDNVSGLATLTKAGAGNITLSGNNTYSGGTTIAPANREGQQQDRTALNYSFQAGSGVTVAKTLSAGDTLGFSGGTTYRGATLVNGGTLVANADGAAVHGSSGQNLALGTAAAPAAGAIAGVMVVNASAATPATPAAPTAAEPGYGLTAAGKGARGTDLAGWAESATETRGGFAKGDENKLVPLRTELPKPMLAGTPKQIGPQQFVDYASRVDNERLREVSKQSQSQLGDLSDLKAAPESTVAPYTRNGVSKKLEDRRKNVAAELPVLESVATADAPVLPPPVKLEPSGDRRQSGVAPSVGGVVVTSGRTLDLNGRVADNRVAAANGKDQQAWYFDQAAARKNKEDWGALGEKAKHESAPEEAQPVARQLARASVNRMTAADDFSVAPAKPTGAVAAGGKLVEQEFSDKDGTTTLSLETDAPAKAPLVIKGVARGYAGRMSRADADGDKLRAADPEGRAAVETPQPLATTVLGRELRTAGEGETRKALVAKQKDVLDEALTTKPVFRAASVNRWMAVSDQSFSTFSISVDSASFTLARRYLNGGQRPPPESVRTEEFVNYFDYAYAPPGRDLFSVHAQAARTPFCPPGVQLLKLGIKGRQLGRENRGANLTFLLDNSGSMNAPDRLGLAREALKLLVARLGPADRVALITFSSRARLVLDFTPATEQKQILAALDGIQAAGFTHLEGGLKLAYQTAARGFVSGAANRVILMSDGVANVGADATAELLAQVEQYRKQNIFCSVFGLGTGTYDDTMLQALASKGNGTYLFMDSLDEARRVFVDELAATLNKIAADVKIQVEFNPRRVKQYRQLGYEQRQLKTEDFRNDAVAAAEVGSGQSVTALYQVELQGDANEPIGTVRVRGRHLETGRVQELERAITAADLAPSFEQADVRFRLAAAAAEFAELLRGSAYVEGTTCADVAKVLRPIALELNLDQKVQELLRLVNAAHSAPQAAE